MFDHTPHSSTRSHLLTIAQRVAGEFARDSRSIGMLIAGSVARGPVDAISDIDMSLYLSEPYTTEEMEAEKERAIASGGGFYGGTAAEGFALWRCVDGVKVDIGIGAATMIDEIIDDLQANQSLDNDTHLIADGIQRSTTLFGEDLITPWKARLDDFPEELARAMVKENLRLPTLWILRDMCVGRGERIWYAEMMLDYTRRLLWILCGLNRRYYPGKTKGFAYVASTLAIAPASFRDRMESLMTFDAARSVDEMHALADETYALVESLMPEIETAEARAWLVRKQSCKS